MLFSYCSIYLCKETENQSYIKSNHPPSNYLINYTIDLINNFFMVFQIRMMPANVRPQQFMPILFLILQIDLICTHRS